MTKASDNAFPSILITEGTEPSAPAAGKQRLYIDSTTHKLKRTDSSGIDVVIESSGAGVSYFSRRLLATIPNATETINVNSTTYVAPPPLSFYHDWDFFAASHFLITAHGQSNEASQTITCQLTPFASPTNPVSAAGDDLVISNTSGHFSSGWIAVSDAMSGLTIMCVSVKGSTATADFTGRFLDIAFKKV